VTATPDGAGLERKAGPAGSSSRPTMKDVAQAAGVSLKTVSRVVNGEPGVGAETAGRVTQSIARLGFRRNELARSLRRSSATLGLIIEDLANPFYSAIARAVEDMARR
jgi:LacI family transcriptional regulator